MQELCKSKLSWDERITGDSLSKWMKLVGQLTLGCPLTLPRCCINAPINELTQYRLYGFCDASLAAYAAVVYLAEETTDKTQLQFVVCKTRVAPLKPQTIPRLELLSALLLSRILVSVSESLRSRLPLQVPKCFTDSTVALYWITGVGKDWKPFVQNRVNEIRESIPVSSWNHCPGTLNPADIPSRGVTVEELASSTLWRNGPTLAQISTGNHAKDMPELCSAEMKAHMLLTPVWSTSVGHVIQIDRFSNLHKLYQVTAHVIRFIRLLLTETPVSELTSNCLHEAEQLWIKDCQLMLEENGSFDSWKLQFGLFQDSNKIWRCGGRLQNTSLPFSTVHPILLDRTHPLTKLIVIGAHRRVQHNGVKETLCELRGKFWIVKGRSLVKQIIGKCVVCRRFEGLPFSPPPAPPLPSYRVNEAPPFTYTAVDYAGPLYLKRSKDAEECKVWISLFTCCVTRAVHLELVNELSAIAFIRCLKKFAARRGVPRTIVSDNATTFKAAAKAIESMLNHSDVKQYLLNLQIEWNFNLEKAPWWGGLFERLIKSMKRCLRKMIGQARLSYDEMHTVVLEVEAILNCRPLSYTVSNDIEEPLTPSHLLVGRRLLSLPDDLTYIQEEDEDFELTTESLQKRIRYLNGVINQFWQRWSREYLLELRESHRYLATPRNKPPIKEGDIVLVQDRDQPRGFWRLARVQKLLCGKDNQVRGAEVRISTPAGQISTLERPVQALYPLELNHPLTESASAGTASESQEAPADPSASPRVRSPPPATKPSRRAAVRAKEQFKVWAVDLSDEEVDLY